MRIMKRPTVQVLNVVIVLAIVYGGIATPAEGQSSLRVEGEVESVMTGFRFPDGSLQTTAAASSQALDYLSINLGLYQNKIADFVHDVAFVEVCFKNGGVSHDQNAAMGSSQGGSCVPGDIG